MARFARYASREVRSVWFNGAGYVVRHDEFPHTVFTDAGPDTQQGHAVYVGARRGEGFSVTRYSRPRTQL